MNFLDERLPDRFWAKVSPEPNSGCWLWIGGLNGGGYGAAYIDQRQRPAHRVTFEIANGPAAPGLDLDHLCRVRCCCNPEHLEAVTRRENLMRGETRAGRNAIKTHCSRGHELSLSNIWQSAKTRHRQCKTCFYAKRRERNAQKAGV